MPIKVEPAVRVQPIHALWKNKIKRIILVDPFVNSPLLPPPFFSA